MANEFIGINKGAAGRGQGDYTFGTSSTAASDFEFRMANPTADGKTPLRKDAILALENMIYFLLNNYGDKYPPL